MLLSRLRDSRAMFTRVKLGYVTNGRTMTLVPQPKKSNQENSESASANVSQDSSLHGVKGQEMMPMMPRSADETRPFDEVPGPRVLKFMAVGRRYLTALGTQITARLLTLAFKMDFSFGALAGFDYVNPLVTLLYIFFPLLVTLSNREPEKLYHYSKLCLKNKDRTVRTWGNSYRHLKYLFDEYGPVVRFISPLGGDIVLTNSPRHIASVYAQEGPYPVRSTLDSLQQYRCRRAAQNVLVPYSLPGEDWLRQRSAISIPLESASTAHAEQLWSACGDLADKINRARNSQDELPSDFYCDLHKWAFDCMGHIILSKKTPPLHSEVLDSQSDSRCLYAALVEATAALAKCEGGIQLWKLFDTPAWLTLVERLETMEGLISKQVLYSGEQTASDETKPVDESESEPLIGTVLRGDKLTTEDAITVVMDMLLIGVNTTASATGFLLYNVARSQKTQKQLYSEIESAASNMDCQDIANLKDNTPYLQACIKETLRLVPPIPVLTRVLPKSIVLDKFNIPRGTLVIMSTQDSSLKESNFEDATRFNPERWQSPDAKDFDAFASIPFGFGARKCLGQGLAEAAITMLTVKLMQKYKLEYHYGDIAPTSTFIARPNKSLNIRFADRQ